MSHYPEIPAIHDIIAKAQHIVVLQADNPDADSLGSALALEHLLGGMGKTVSLYCGIDAPAYLRYLSGWDRVSATLPHQFDASIIVDASSMTLFEKLVNSGQQGWVAGKPCIVLDHHANTDNSIAFANVVLNDPSRSSTGEIIYTLANDFDWPLDASAAAYLMTAILGDTQGLTNDLTTAHTYRIMAALTEKGVNRPLLEEQRREYSKMDAVIFRYKAQLIERTELHAEGAIALVTIPQAEINEFSPLYNPAPLIQSDWLLVKGVRVGVVLKHYDDGRMLCSIRCAQGSPVAADLAVHFGGGGHAYASGFKITDGRPLNEIKSECIAFATQLLDNLDKERTNETVQHTYQTD